MKKSSRILQEVDPDLTIVPASHTSRRMTPDDWDKLDGTKCPVCRNDVLRVYGPQKLCYKCFYSRKETTLEESTCSKCGREAAKVTSLADGLLEVKLICPECGTYRTT